jgi:hypothetical protein
MLPLHAASAPGSSYVAKEEVDLITIDSIVSSLHEPASRIFVKIDAQGYESTILKGAADSLSLITGIELEMSLFPLYDGEILFRELDANLQSLGFALMSLEPVFFSVATRQVMQFNGVYFRVGDRGRK